ncbi:protein sidekick-1-like isoform X2 [Stylophora pistillata]|uniref:protein sidekick-1-like isoform X2 n=1 Tax=Stylophora pistillata TaxID=50429 RepID=UPI000C050EA9|nr:protein sidekick-1-like isoform X2 [Stylophora pistillata]
MSAPQIVKQILCLALCLDMVREQKSLLCEYKAAPPSSLNDSLAKFLPSPSYRPSGYHKISFQQLSVKECAQLCLQVAGENIYNCSSFEHITATRDCLLTELSCKDHELLLDNSRSFYQLKGPNRTTPCAAVSSSTSLSTSFIRPSTVSQIASFTSTIATSQDTPRLKSESNNLTFQVKLRLENESWRLSYENKSSGMSLNMSSALEENIFLVIGNASSLLQVSVLQLRNTSGLVIADIRLTFSGEFHLRHTNQFYSFLSKSGRLGSMPISVINDTFPGKPPEQLNVTVQGPTALHVSWSSERKRQVIENWGLRVIYKATDNIIRSVLVKESQSEVNISRLQPGTTYTIWTVRVTSKGFGFPSKALNITTRHRAPQDVSIHFKVLLMNVSWDTQLGNKSSETSMNLSSVIETSVIVLHQNESSFKNVSSIQISNYSGETLVSMEALYNPNTKMRDLYNIYEALYIEKRLQNLQIKVIDDNIPGKPPRNLTSIPLSPSSINVTWNFPQSNHCEVFPLQGFRTFYSLQKNVTNIQFVDVKSPKNYIFIQNLENFKYYSLWVQTITSRGLGPKSTVVLARTLEKVVPINASVQLINKEWTDDFLNLTSSSFMNLTKQLQTQVAGLYPNETHLRDIVIHRFRNDSGKVIADMVIIFGQQVEMEQFITLYQALYRNGSLGDLTVHPTWDNIPGKPPENISALASSTTSIRVNWNRVPSDSDIIQFKVYYVTADSQNETISMINVNATKDSVGIGNLEKFVNYTVWVRSVSRRGPGLSSLLIYVRTLEEVVPINLTIRFTSMKWNANLSNPESGSFRNLSQTIRENILTLYGQESSYLRDVRCHRFTNGSVLADMTIVYGQNVGPQQFRTIYKALYQDGRLGNLTVQPVSDNVPGKPPANITAKSNTSTSIEVTWLCVDCQQHNFTVAFLISYKHEKSNRTVGRSVNKTVRKLLITGLGKYTNYTVYVTSITSWGLGLPGERLSILTQEDVPSLAPANLRAHNTSSTSLQVAWEPLPVSEINGILLGYKVTYKKRGVIFALEQSVNTTLNFTILIALDKFTVYDVNVSAFTRVGNGPEANVTISTDQDVPSLPPTNLAAYNTSSTSLMVTWNPVPLGFTHGIVRGYMVLYKREKYGNESYSNITSSVTSANLTSLDKFTMYLIKVLAFTIKGSGAVTNDTRVRTREDVPSLPPKHLAAHNTSSTSLMVTWSNVPDGFVHGILRGYRVLFKTDQGISYRNVTTANQSFELTSLEKFTKYTVKVLAFTRIGDGNKSDPVTVSTDEDVPSLPPKNVSSYNTSSTSVHVSWHEVPVGFVHGILLGYRVLYKEASALKNQSIVSTSANTKTKELQGLQKFTVYEISVLAFTRIGDGINSTTLFVSTDEDIPSLPPSDVAAHNTSSTSLMVIWRKVPKGFVHGILRGYRVFYKKTEDEESYLNSTTGPTEQELSITGLKKFTEYSMKVLAFTIKGDGAVSNNISVTTDEDVPSLPPQRVHSYNTSSTSVNVTWLEVPIGFVHGILQGYRVFYSVTENQSAIVPYTIVPARNLFKELTGLKKFTNYTVQVAAFTRIGYGAKSLQFIVSTDEDVPSRSPQNLWANNISSTALRITWNPVPTGFVHGILRGYRILYKEKNKPSAPYTKITVSPGVRKREIHDLKKFTYYSIQVLAFTIKGDGIQSPTVDVSTDEDTPSETPQNVYARDKESATKISVSWQSPPAHTIHGILRGYYIWYSIISLGIHDKTPVFPKDYVKKKLSASMKSDVLIDLESYAKYDIRIAAFTSKGHGPIKDITTRTCRCRSTIPTNWWNNPPYVSSRPNSNSSKESGIIPAILQQIVTHCCQSCAEFGTSAVDFTTDADGLEAKKNGVIEVKDAISTKTMISFGVAGVMPQETYHSPDGDAEYVPIMETPGVAFIVAERRDIHKEVLLAILSCWPAVVIACVMTYLAGIVVWALDMNWNHVDFPKSFVAGSLEGFWWSFVTMTTVGYGERIPKSILARSFAFLWTWIGIATMAVVTSSITASLMSMVFQSEKMLYGTKLAAIANSSEYQLGLRRNAILNTDRSYGNIYDIYDDLENNRVHAALLDSYSTASETKLFSKDWIRVIEIIPVRYESANGLVLTGDATRLARCFRRYVKSETSSIHRTIQKNVGSIEAGDVPFAVKTSSELLTEESYVYVNTVIILGASLGVFTLCGLFWHFCFSKRTPSPKPSESAEQIVVVDGSSKSRITRQELMEQLKQDIAEFYASFRRRYLALRRKHIEQIKEFRRERSGNQDTEFRRLTELAANRRGHYVVTKDADINSIFEGMDMTIFDKRSSNRW